MIIFLHWTFFSERPRRLDVVTCALVFAGIACFVIDGLGGGGILGNALALLSSVTYAGVFMMNKIPGGDALSATFLGQMLSGVIGTPFVALATDFRPTTLLLFFF